MQGFCPLCLENGISTEVKAFQLNFEEAIFMCSSATCPWPLDCEEFTFINRSIGKDWSKACEELAVENIKKCSQIDKTVPDELTAFVEENICINQEDSTTISKPCDFSLSTTNINNESNLAFLPINSEPNIDNGSKININNGSILATLPADSEPVKCETRLLPMNSDKKNGNVFTVDRKSTKLDTAVITVNSNSTSLVSNFVPAKTNNLSCSLPRLSKTSKLLRSNVFNRSRAKTRSFKKFSLNDLQKLKSTSAEKETVPNSVAPTKKTNNENSNESNKMSNYDENQVKSDSDLTFDNVSRNSETVKNGDSEFNVDDFLNSYCKEISTKANVENTDEYDWIESLLF